MPLTCVAPGSLPTTEIPTIHGLHSGCGTSVPMWSVYTNCSDGPLPPVMSPALSPSSFATDVNAIGVAGVRGDTIWSGLRDPVRLADSCRSSIVAKPRMYPPSANRMAPLPVPAGRPRISYSRRTSPNLPPTICPFMIIRHLSPPLSWNIFRIL